MVANTYLKLTQIPPETILNLFSKQYAYEKGEKKVKEIVEKLELSKKVDHYLAGLSTSNIKPSPKGLQILLNTIGYFAFSKAETLCLGGLNVLYRWQMQNLTDVDQLGSTKDSNISAEFIVDCERAKVHSGQNVFSRFFFEVDKYEPIAFDFDDF